MQLVLQKGNYEIVLSVCLFGIFFNNCSKEFVPSAKICNMLHANHILK